MFDEITHYKSFKGKGFRAKQKSLYQELRAFKQKTEGGDAEFNQITNFL